MSDSQLHPNIVNLISAIATDKVAISPGILELAKKYLALGLEYKEAVDYLEAYKSFHYAREILELKCIDAGQPSLLRDLQIPVYKELANVSLLLAKRERMLDLACQYQTESAALIDNALDLLELHDSENTEELVTLYLLKAEYWDQAGNYASSQATLHQALFILLGKDVNHPRLPALRERLTHLAEKIEG